MRYIFNAFTEELEAPNNPSPLYENLGKRFNLAGGGRTGFLKGSDKVQQIRNYEPVIKVADNIFKIKSSGNYLVEFNYTDNEGEKKKTQSRKNIKTVNAAKKSC